MTTSDTPFDQAIADQVTELLYSYDQYGMYEQREALLNYIESHLDDDMLATVISSALEYQKAFTNQ